MARHIPADAGQQLALDFGFDAKAQRAIDIELIHQATGIYTARPEVDALLSRLNWPSGGQTLLDPGCGGGDVLVGALARLDLGRDDVDTAVYRVKGFEFHAGAVTEARRAVRGHLAGRGWSDGAAERAAIAIVENRDYLLSPLPAGTFTTIAANPPYLRLAHLPAAYREEYESIVPLHARPDLLYAYLDRSTEVVAAGGRLGLITADRWLLNAYAGPLRDRLGKLYRVQDVRRLDPESSFYQAKTRRKGTPPRVHPVSLTLNPGSDGQELSAAPFPLDPLPAVEGTPLRELAEIRLAPYLGPAGIFLVDAATAAALPRECLAPAVEPGDIDGQEIRPPRKWALITRRAADPPAAIRAHLERNIGRMPPGHRKDPWWLPPEPFDGRLPLDRDAVLVPRIATHLKAVRLPAGHLPVNHQLVVISGLPVPAVIAMLSDPDVQAQADALARRVDNGYRDYTTSLLRQLVIPRHLLAGTTAARPALLHWQQRSPALSVRLNSALPPTVRRTDRWVPRQCSRLRQAQPPPKPWKPCAANSPPSTLLARSAR